MLNFFRKRSRAQGTLEYALLIGLVIAALVAMQHYMRRGIQGRARSATESIGEQYDAEQIDSYKDLYRDTNSWEHTETGVSQASSNTYDETKAGAHEKVGLQPEPP